MDKLRTMVITTSRADYGLLCPLMKKLAADACFDLRLVVTGSHLSIKHGDTIEYIRNDGFTALEKVDMLPSGDTDTEICNSAAEGLKGFNSVMGRVKPDVVVVLGDRYELWPACISAVLHKVPIAHIHGGETTLGAIDESVRHSVTKMAAVHFPSIELYGKRIIQMGEDPGRVFVVGALGIDNIKGIEPMNIQELSDFTGVDFLNGAALMTFHPATLDRYESAPRQIREVFEALLDTGLETLVTAPNTDAGGNLIFDAISAYAYKHPSRVKLVNSLGQKAYLSAMKHSRVMVGNSSSGIIESSSFRLPVVNIGDRQGGRYKPANVIDCGCSREEISAALDKALSKGFADSISNLENPYGDGNTAERIVSILKTIDFKNRETLIKKKFYDLEF